MSLGLPSTSGNFSLAGAVPRRTPLRPSSVFATASAMATRSSRQPDPFQALQECRGNVLGIQHQEPGKVPRHGPAVP